MVSGNVLSLTDVLRIHHFHLDRALITELCHLLNIDLQSEITQTTSPRVATAFVHPSHPSDRLSIEHDVQGVCAETPRPRAPSGVDKSAQQKGALVFLIKCFGGAFETQ